MSDEIKDGEHQVSPQGGAGFRVPPRTWIVWITIFGGIILLMLFRDRMDSEGDRISQYRFEQLVDSNLIVRATINYDPQSPLNEVVGKYFKIENDRRIEVPFQAKLRLTPRLEEQLLSSPQFEARQPNNMLLKVVWSILPIVIIAVLIWFFFIRRIKRISRESPDLQMKTAEQQDRLDRILDKWEQQARRMDGVLDKLERDK